MKTKQHIRDDIKQLFNMQSREVLSSKSASICEQLLKYIRDSHVQNICIYESMNDEVNTQELIETLRKEKIPVFTPQVVSPIDMIIIDEDFQIYEKDIDMFIIPARAYTSNGKRLGRGKWYYDRFLAQGEYKKSKKIGIWYDFQIVEDLPVEKHDIVMNRVITNI